jgi:hypothetical protein
MKILNSIKKDLSLFKLNKSSLKQKKTSKFFPPSFREWDTSIYSFNKSITSILSITQIHVVGLIKDYLNLFNSKIEQGLRKKRLSLKSKRLSSNKIFITSGEYKHTNNKVYVTIYAYNRQKLNYILTLRKYIKNFYGKLFYHKKDSGFIYENNINWNNFESIIKTSKGYTLENVKYKNKTNIFNKKYLDRLNTLNDLTLETLNDIDKYKVIKTLNKGISNYSDVVYNSIHEHILAYQKKLVSLFVSKLKVYFFYKKLLFINKSLFNYTYLQYLKKNIEYYYNKNVEFNIINIRKFYLNSEILSEIAKLKITKNRKNMMKYLNKIKEKIKIKKIPLFSSTNNIKSNNTVLNNENELNKFVFDNLKHKHVTGFRLEAKGRLTRRFTASRSMYKLKYKGNLLGIDSSYRGLSSVLLRGNTKSNIEFNRSESKTRIGSFGIKSWISGN